MTFDEPARTEWGWSPTYDYDAIIDDFVAHHARGLSHA
jgi:hypothetical protein